MARTPKLAAAYSVSITGIKRTRSEIEKLDDAIAQLRNTDYSVERSATSIVNSGRYRGLLVARIDDLGGRIQGRVIAAMDAAVKDGKGYQTLILAKATTPTGTSGRGRNPQGRRGPGRDDTGDLINAIETNVEISKTVGETQVVGWHGWADDAGPGYQKYQEDPGYRTGVNSLGITLPVVREQLKTKLGKLKK